MGASSCSGRGLRLVRRCRGSARRLGGKCEESVGVPGMSGSGSRALLVRIWNVPHFPRVEPPGSWRIGEPAEAPGKLARRWASHRIGADGWVACKRCSWRSVAAILRGSEEAMMRLCFNHTGVYAGVFVQLGVVLRGFVQQTFEPCARAIVNFIGCVCLAAVCLFCRQAGAGAACIPSGAHTQPLCCRI